MPNTLTQHLQGPWYWGSALRWYAIALLVIGLDQWTKTWASSSLVFGHPEQVTSFFDWLLLHNYGAAFSFLSDESGWQRWFFTILAVVVSAVLSVWLALQAPARRWEPIALALILGGAIGNVVDRISLGYVVDFISLHYQGARWPAFNIADSAICAGAVMLLIDMWRPEQKLNS
ncbi:MAG: signal peptidase II [Cellvibrionaceae bacterium]|nr:signal peptidase II [Cellvibrionaceae bacterium]